MKAYIAAPLFNDAEKAFNLTVDEAVRGAGFGTFLPQRDGGEAAPLVRMGMNEHEVRRRLFDLDTAAVAECAVLVMVVDGRVPDEGACVELGMAHALGKVCVGLQTDSRRFGGTDSNNLMVDYALTGGMVRTLPDLTALLRDVFRTLAGT
ncbi:nucleoside 2-deoxyribosyltransferase [Yinghuangia sp. ASG 101]|uniref:nucleoside 2-deoxyribosyltransferase n=1 Tax=Yinghuangia sp. ASG 101 TaxID=2896848 RepID=UPI001E394B44|nr:nucleoside 2-deoxyribosyltransferase [Yinghuangia sp. ASG 101]UGQ10501.1 nucleoside 2-deoxyribosyltransferase [Yinghuangia sp. ASG 101]